MKQSLKLLELLEESIDRQVENGIYEIERDLLLERLRGIYASVVAAEAVAEEERVLDALMGIGVASQEEEPEPEIEVERIFAEEEEPEEEVEEEMNEEEGEAFPEEEDLPCAMYGCPPAEFEEMQQCEVEEEEPIVEEEVAPEEPAVEEGESVQEEIDHEAVLSLYDDDDEEEVEQLPEEPIEEPAIEEEIVEVSEPEIEEKIEEVVEEESAPEEEPTKEEVVADEAPAQVVLGDVLSGEQTTLADNLAEQTIDVATAASASMSLRSAIGINDKYILLRDLFAGDSDYYERAIDRLDEFDSLDEAMLYIYDNFHWNPNSEGARLLMELLARKLF